MNHIFQHWILEVVGPIATMTLNRPEKKNRIDNTSLEELGRITSIISSNPEIWVVIVKANGDIFSGGVDVSLIGSLVNQETELYRSNLRYAQSFLDQFEALQKPTIAALHGHVVGGGMILSLCCDFRIGAENVIFSLPEVKRSIGVIMGTQRITRTIGMSYTKEMVMLGRPVHAQKAVQIGLLNCVVPLEQLYHEADTWAERIIQLPPLAVGLNKKIINEGQFLDRAGQELEIAAQEKLLGTEDFKEAIDSYFEKRSPIYKAK